MENNVKEQIIELIESILQVSAGTVTENTKMEDLEQWDSLAHVMIIGELEEKLGISIPLEKLLKLERFKKF